MSMSTSTRTSHRPNARLAAYRPAILGLAKLLALPFASAAPLATAILEKTKEREPEHHGATDNASLVVYLIVAVVLVLLGGVFAGLTIALMGQDETYLQVIASSGDGTERKHATTVLNLLKKGKHWVLVTLLLSNVITNETLPIVLDRSLGGGWPAVVSSTVLIVIFGEVAPQSVCVRYGLSIGAFMAPFVLMLMWIMGPVAWPTARLLDWLLGEDHGTTYKKAGLKTLVSLHKTLGADTTDRLLEDEVTIINSVLDLKEKPVGDIMTPMQDVFTMSAETVLDEKMMDTILSQGYSRIPIHSPDNYRNFIGMLLVKILITYDPEDCKKVREFSLATLPETAPNTSCLDIINFFQEGKSHMVLVSDCPGQDHGALGVVTLEDVIEELIGEEIIDESDVFIDVHKAIRRLAPAPKTRFSRFHNEAAASDVEQDAKEADEEAPLLSKRVHELSHKPSLRSANTSYLVRRKSSNASEATRGESRPAVARTNTNELRQSLKHLGPSNAASKPRATKYTAVKIKPGVGTIPENKSMAADADHSAHHNHADHTPEPPEDAGLSIIKPDGASNGVAALHAGYGTLDSTPSKRPLSSGDKVTPREASQLARQHTPNGADRTARDTADDELETNGKSVDSLLRPPEKLVIGAEPEDENDTIGEMSSSIRDKSKDRRVARSGSITQTTVDSNGLKKMVLETTSSSEDHDDTTISPRTSVTGGSANGDEEADGEDEATSAGKANSKNKRKKRGKRKKNGSG